MLTPGLFAKGESVQPEWATWLVRLDEHCLPLSKQPSCFSGVITNPPSHIIKKTSANNSPHSFRDRVFPQGQNKASKEKKVAAPTFLRSLLCTGLGALCVIFLIVLRCHAHLMLLGPIFSSLLGSVWPSWQSWQHTYFLGWQTVYAELCAFPFRMLGYKHTWWPTSKNNQNGQMSSAACCPQHLPVLRAEPKMGNNHWWWLCVEIFLVRNVIIAILK